MGRAWRREGWEGAQTSAPLTPPPRPHTHARPAAGGSRSPPGPGPARRLLARGLAGFRAWRRPQAGWSPSLWAQVQRVHPMERWQAGPTPASQSEREAQHGVSRAPGGSRLRLPGLARSRLIWEAKQGRAWLGYLDGRPPGIPGAVGFCLPSP